MPKKVKQKFFTTAVGISDDQGNSLVTTEKKVFVTGFIGASGTQFNGQPVENMYGSRDIFVAGLDHCGKQKFFTTAGSALFDNGISLVATEKKVFVTGYINATGTQFNGQPVENQYGGQDIFVATRLFP